MLNFSSTISRRILVALVTSIFLTGCSDESSDSYSSNAMERTSFFSSEISISERYINLPQSSNDLSTLTLITENLKKAYQGKDRVSLSSSHSEMFFRLRAREGWTETSFPTPVRSDRYSRMDLRDLTSMFLADFSGKSLSADEIDYFFSKLLKPSQKTEKPAVPAPSEELISFSSKSPVSFHSKSGILNITLRIDGLKGNRELKLPVDIIVNYRQLGNSLKKIEGVLVKPRSNSSGGVRLSRRQKIAVEDLQEEFETRFIDQLVHEEQPIENSDLKLKTNKVFADNNILVVSKIIAR